MEKYTITYLRKNSVIKTIFGVLLGLAGLASVLFLSILMGFMCIGYSLKLLLREGTQIDLASKTYRTVYSFFGLLFGKWQPIPPVEYVSVFKTREGTPANLYGATVATVQTSIIHLNLFYGSKHFTAYKTEDKEDAFKVANHLKLALDIDILDATEKEKKWL
ncbi:MAG: hypothetical protein EOO50_02695 [Flavobacterium sp.]|uniref:hypothetical protein n=1 Tax=Flavobacterium sp. TaxID=239 RepID=UPI00121C8337|nr:hypothetical protein [Flavobacterium sp.]RZJ68347.1 MAG: hypothetical protein EOO50_02695 [Flavobacterium sp.]